MNAPAFAPFVGMPSRSAESNRAAREARPLEDQAAARLGVAWSCDVFRFAEFSPLDWYCSRGPQFIGVAEIKCRKVRLGAYPTIWLAVRKYHWLTLAAERHKCGAVFVVGYTDALMWINASDIDARAENIRANAGRIDRGLANDVEPMIEIPVSSLLRVPTVVEPEPI